MSDYISRLEVEDIKELEARTIKSRNPQPKKLNSLTLAIKIGA